MKITMAMLVIGLTAIANAEMYTTKSAGQARKVGHRLIAPKPAARVSTGSTKVPNKARTTAYATEAPANYETKATIAPTTTPTTTSSRRKAAKYKSEKPTAKLATVARHKREIALHESNDLAAESLCKPCKEKSVRCIYGFENGKDGCSTCTCANPCSEIKCANGLKCNLIQVNCIKAPCDDSLLRLCLPRQMVKKN